MKILVTGDRNWLNTPEIEKLLEEGEYGPDHGRTLEILDEIKAIKKDRKDFIYDVLDSYYIPDMNNPPIIVEGGAKGADTIAREWATDRGIEYREYPAKWSEHGRAAGPIRNQEMLDKEQPDLVIAFHPNLNGSKGTNHMVNYANRKGVDVHIYNGKERLDADRS